MFKIVNSRKYISDLEVLRAWTKENGFIYPSSEIYGGFSAVYDYGHLGYLLKENIKRNWEKSVVHSRNDMVLLDSAIFMHPKTWHASGHVSNFSDILIENKKTNIRYRADHVVEDWLSKKTDQELEYFCTKTAKKNIQEMIKKRDLDKSTPEEIYEVMKITDFPDLENFTKPRTFSLMIKTNLGITDGTIDNDNAVFPRAETCQGIYLNFKNVLQTYRLKIPFGIAQTGKAFRNEIIARQFIFRTREFEQMEMQYFLHPNDMNSKFEEWKNLRLDWYVNELGISPSNLRLKKHEKLAHYASQAFDIEYKFESLSGYKELEGIHARGDWDLSSHSKMSGENMEYYDQQRNEKYIPHVLETSVGLNRCVMMLIEENLYEEEFINNEKDKNTAIDKRIVLKIKKNLAPIQVAILPLSKKPELIHKTLEIQQQLRNRFITSYDETGSIGKRYRRQDEIGTPYCVTVDFDSLEDNCITIRNRDDMTQIRVPISEIQSYLMFD